MDAEGDGEFCSWARERKELMESSLGAQDLYNYQMALQEIDGMRVNGKFKDAEGNVPEGQLVSSLFRVKCGGGADG